VLAPVLIAVGIVSGWNLQGWPGRVNDDEGTYVAEAWAMLVPHHISNYTYWYDHPFLGWAQMACWIWLTDGFHRYPSAVMAGREFMWVVNLASCAMLYLIARRIHLRRGIAAVAVLLFGLSPLAIFFHRLVFLDNIAVAWMLAALALAATPRRSMAAAMGSGVCFAVATLSKETIALLLPTIVWMLWQHTDRRTRVWNLGVFSLTFVLIVLSYPLFAALRGELFPGKGHVSLLWSLSWQLLNRAGSGSILNTHSGTYGLALLWTGLDPWLLAGGIVLLPIGFAIRQLRPIAFALGFQVALLLRGGYVPYMYVTAMLPFCSLLIGGVAEAWWRRPRAEQAEQHRSHKVSRLRRLFPMTAGRLTVLVGVMLFAVFVAPTWCTTLSRQANVNGAAPELAATAWIEHHVPKGAVVVVDDYMWTDIEMDGRAATPLSIWKVNGDPWVTRHILPDGYKSIDYVVLTPQSSSTIATMPTLEAALMHSKPVENFGDGLIAHMVIKN
jgi:Dolichyl-phosphate-mannose-protein mannosyltransferase